ncbi:replication initiation protein [uncultured Gilliamella sp.]|jgi:Protein involved in initiation of plasmid replication|uniref:replication initiation protein n=1 Tax=uncultured Gilliamella sp. TaxID=1193505 RepID=UPI00344658ED
MNVLFNVKDPKLTKKFRWIQSAEYKNNNGLAIIEFRNAVMPYLCQLEKQFTNYQLRNISGFNRTYSIRLLLLAINLVKISKISHD